MDDGLHLMFGYSPDSTDPTADEFDFSLSNLSPGGTTIDSVGRGHVFFCSLFKWSDAAVQEAARRKRQLWNTPFFMRSRGKLKTPTPRRPVPPAAPAAADATAQPPAVTTPVCPASRGCSPTSPLLRSCSPTAENVQTPHEEEDELDVEGMAAMDEMEEDEMEEP